MEKNGPYLRKSKGREAPRVKGFEGVKKWQYRNPSVQNAVLQPRKPLRSEESSSRI